MQRVYKLAGMSLTLIVVSGAASLAQESPGSPDRMSERGPRFLLNAFPTPMRIDMAKTPILRRRITVNFENVKLSDALRTIADESGLKLVFTGKVIEAERTVQLKAEHITVAGALTEVLMESDVDVVFERDGQAAVVKRLPIPPVPVVGTIAGQVTDSATGQGVSRAQVIVVGKSLGAVADESGRYRIAGVPPGAHEVSARRVGYAPITRRITVTDGATATLDFVLARAATTLTEVVTTVTGQEERYKIGHSVSTVRADSVVKETPVYNLSDLLANRVPGAVIKGQNGLTGTVSPIRLRGLNSFTVANDPIVILDGARIESSASGQGKGGNFSGSARLGDLNMNEVESIDVVKGPAAATLYGTDAANGVIVIKTKRGRVGNLRWDGYGEAGSIVEETDRFPDSYYGWGHATATGAALKCQLAAVAAGTCVQDSITAFNPLKNSQATSIAPGHRGMLGLQASGGVAQFRYLFAGGWEGEQGWMRMPLVEQTRIMAGQGLAEIPDWQLRPNNENKVNARGNLSAGFGTRGDLTLSNGFITQAFRQASTAPFSNSVWGGLGYDDPLNHGYRTQIGETFQVKTADNLVRFISSLTGNYRPLDWLTTRATLGFDFSHDAVDNLQMTGQGPRERVGPDSARSAATTSTRSRSTLAARPSVRCRAQ